MDESYACLSLHPPTEIRSSCISLRILWGAGEKKIDIVRNMFEEMEQRAMNNVCERVCACNVILHQRMPSSSWVILKKMLWGIFMICHTKALILWFVDSALCPDSYLEIYKSTRHSEMINSWCCFEAALFWTIEPFSLFGFSFT